MQKSRIKYYFGRRWLEKHPFTNYVLGIFVGLSIMLGVLITMFSYGVSLSTIVIVNYETAGAARLLNMVDPDDYRDIVINWTNEIRNNNEFNNQYDENSIIALEIAGKIRKHLDIYFLNRTETEVIKDIDGDGEIDCQDISVITCSIMKNINVPCRIALTKNNNNEVGHVFNVIYLNGQWKFVDIAMGKWENAVMYDNTVILG